jgi:hypothetical protein
MVSIDGIDDIMISTVHASYTGEGMTYLFVMDAEEYRSGWILRGR